MLSGVPGSVNSELLESSLLTTWPFCASRPVGGGRWYSWLLQILGGNTNDAAKHILAFKLNVYMKWEESVGGFSEENILKKSNSGNTLESEMIEISGYFVEIWTHRVLCPVQCWFSGCLRSPPRSGHLWIPGWQRGGGDILPLTSC